MLASVEWLVRLLQLQTPSGPPSLITKYKAL
jgi:hypothetical protein